MSLITLPLSSLVYMDNEIIEINIPDEFIRKINYSNIENARGIFKNRKVDPVKYQRDLRNEWP